MANLPSKNELLQKLCLLKNTLQRFDFSLLQNIIFMNSSSFYSYISKINCENNTTIEKILEEIEDCIPFALTDDSFEIFITAANQEKEEKMEALRKGFIEGCKMDFLYLILDTDTEEKWNKILDSCEKLRQQKDRIIFAKC